MATLKRQAFVLTLANAYTRALGFALRLFTARMMGAQAIGVMELASSAVMLAITPVTAGVPTAMSRLVARGASAARDAPANVLRAGTSLVRRLSFVLMPTLLALSPAIAWLLGDMATLPTILCSVPAILLLGLCSVYSGWFYGLGDACTPALNECAEQTVRVLLTLALLTMWITPSTGVMAALPVAAETMAGVVVLLLFRRKTPRCAPGKVDPAITRELIALTAPTTGARLCQTALRALNAVLLPTCLRRSGLCGDAATAQFGLLGGMVMPILMLPGIVTGAICMVATPAVSRRESDGIALRRISRQLLLSGIAVGGAASAAVFFGAGFVAERMYHEAAVAPLLRFMAPSALLMAVSQVQFGVITGLGLQNKALPGTVAASVLTLLVTAVLAPMPRMRLFGAAIGSMAGSLMRLLWQSCLVHKAVAQSGKA